MHKASGVHWSTSLCAKSDMQSGLQRILDIGHYCKAAAAAWRAAPALESSKSEQQ